MRRIKYIMKALLIVLAIVSLTSCGGGTQSSVSSGATAVTIALSEMALSSSENALIGDAAGIPSEVTHISITITGENMETIHRFIDVAGKTAIYETFKVKSGRSRNFLARALRSDGSVIYQGHRIEDLVGKPKLVEILMGFDISGDWTVYHTPQGGTTRMADYISFDQVGNYLSVGGGYKGSGTIIGGLIDLEFVSNLCAENVIVKGLLAADGTANGVFEASGGCLSAPEAGVWKVVRGKQTGPAPGTLSNSDLSGPWMWLTQYGHVLFVFDGAGGILDVGVFNALIPSARYLVQPDGSFSVSLDFKTNPSAVLSGALLSPSSGNLTAPGGETGSLIKVADLSSCQGSWTGLLRDSSGIDTFNIAFSIDSGGIVTSFSGFTQPVTGRMLCEAGNVAGYFRTGEPLTNPYNQIQISGSLSGNSVTGFFINDSKTLQAGSVSLMRQ
ncbi:MAG: hypothetical protein HZA17_02545 [Nitrospirae bacterium]|nr:hypothetical protein [Nitrospirota bacterium]